MSRSQARAKASRVIAALVAVAASGCGAGDSRVARPIPGWLFFPADSATLVWSRLTGKDDPRADPGGQFARFLPLDAAAPIPHAPIAQHPFMASKAGNNMHEDASMSDTAEAAGPIGLAPGVSSRSEGFGGYGTIAFDRAGRLVGVYSNGRGFRLDLLDPSSLERLAAFDLPGRRWSALLEGIPPWKYIGAGTYFYLDERDRAVVPTAANEIVVVAAPADPSRGGFEEVRRYDVSQHVVPMHWPRQDSVAWVLPDWSGEQYWYATVGGMVGAVDVSTGEVRTLRLDGETIENSFAVGEDGVFILSDHALYRFGRGAGGEIAVDWRMPYDRGPGVKPGHITRGSGTSVTLVGGRDGLVAVTDNADPRVHLLFVRRLDGTLACQAPLFEAGRSGTDISAIAFGHADEAGRPMGRFSAIVENNWGHHRFPVANPAPGLSRIDAVPRKDGGWTCTAVWESPTKNIGVFKLSFGSGLVYTYFRDDRDEIDQFYLTATDFRTGAPAFRLRVGAGQGYNNWSGALFLHPGGGTLYSTTIFGLVMVRDGLASGAADR